MHRLWIAMAGPAGVGKSTLAAGLGATLRRRGAHVDTFGEEELFSRPEFTDVARGFRTKDYAQADIFEAAYRAWLTKLSAGSVGVMDWNPAGMSGDLPWATDQERFRDHLAAVRALAAGPVVLLHLQAPAELTIQRAAAERGEEWLTRSDQVARSAGHDQRDRLTRVAASTNAHIARTRAELDVAASAGWPVHSIVATGSISDVHDRAMSVINRLLTTPSCLP